MKWRKKHIFWTVYFFMAYIFAWFFFPSSVLAKDLDTLHSGPPSDFTFEHLQVEPTLYNYSSINLYTKQLEIAIMGEDCTNWRNLDQSGTAWPSPSNYNWYDQDIRAPFQFPHDPNNVTILSVTVELRVFDIDAPSQFPPSPSEVDIVYLNDEALGTLNETHDTWVWNMFTPSANIIVQGENHIDIDVDAEHTSRFWAMTVDWIKVTIVYRSPSPPSIHEVGGVWVPIDKSELLAPWISLASLWAIAGTISIVYVKKRKKPED